MDDLGTHEPSSFDIRCSNACTRAGIAILLFTTIAILMLHTMTKAKEFDALGKYASLRLQLKQVIEDLQAEPCWIDLMASDLGNQVLTEWNVSSLMNHKCDSSVKPKNDSPELRSHGGLRIIYSLWEADTIADVLCELGDGKLLTDARAYSFRHSQSILRWENMRDRLLSIGRSTQLKLPGYRIPAKGKAGDRDPMIPRDELLSYLMIEDIITLASYELPDLVQIELLQKELSLVTLSSIGIPIRLIAATNFIEFALLLSVIYFWLFFREARFSESFPAPGTLFGAFGRTHLSKLLFKVLIALPPIASALLAMRSFSYTHLNSISAVFILFFSINIAMKSHKRRSTKC